MANWFANEFGFIEELGVKGWSQVRSSFKLEQLDAKDTDGKINSKWYAPDVREAVLVNQKTNIRHHVGRFELASVMELRKRLSQMPPSAREITSATEERQGPGTDRRGLTFCNIMDNAKSLHLNSANAGSVFQVASQFNMLVDLFLLCNF